MCRVIYIFAIVLVVSVSTLGAANERPFRVGVRGIAPDKISDLDPAKSVSSDVNMLLSNIHVGLVGFDEYGNIQPAIARSWTVSKNQRVYTFYLKRGYQFHDGKAVNAHDVKRSLERVVKSKSYASYYLSFIEGAREYAEGRADTIKGIRVLSEKSIEIALHNPFIPFMSYLATNGLAVVREKDSGEIVGCGEYAISEISKNSVLLKRYNTENASGGMKYIQVLFNSGSSGYADMLVKGDADFIYNLYPNDIQWLETHGYEVNSFPSLSAMSIYFNVKSRFFNDRNRRRWVYCEFIRARKLLDNQGMREMDGYLPRGMYGYSNYQARCDLKRPINHSCRVSLLVPTELYNKNEMEYLSNILKKIGVRLRVIKRSYSGPYYEVIKKGDYDAVYTRIVGSINDPDFFYLLFDQRMGINLTHHNDKTIEEMLLKTRTSVDIDNRARMYSKLNEYVLDNAYVLPMWQNKFVYAISNDYRIPSQAYRYSPRYSNIERVVDKGERK